MGFFAPWFLAGAVAVGLPVWLHLLKRHKTDPKLFPSLMFFEYRETSSVKHRRLDYLLLFALRALIVLLLALLFASPFIRRSAAASDGKKVTVVALDRSFSMRDSDHMARAKTPKAIHPDRRHTTRPFEESPRFLVILLLSKHP